jgi:hypothetical protein
VVYRSGSGTKGNGQLERSLLWEVMELFLGDCLLTAENMYIQQRLTPGKIASFANQLTTKLDILTLEKESRINQVDDAACHLFNGVHHICNQINV